MPSGSSSSSRQQRIVKIPYSQTKSPAEVQDLSSGMRAFCCCNRTSSSTTTNSNNQQQQQQQQHKQHMHFLLPLQVDYTGLGVQQVWECTGAFLTRDTLQPYFDKGVPKIVVSAPVKDPNPVLNVVMGCNHVSASPIYHDTRLQMRFPVCIRSVKSNCCLPKICSHMPCCSGSMLLSVI
jgi:hypothetical protein